jgi:hypothetical protein
VKPVSDPPRLNIQAFASLLEIITMQARNDEKESAEERTGAQAARLQ